ncbi:MAG: hypothetical protein H0X67_05515 [Acidobacteria bacterium]|nr:hypothetical protein [Acidobacteriota bacterium]
MRGEFSAVRQEMAEQAATTTATLRQEMAAQAATIITTLRQEVAAQGATIITTLRQEMADQGVALRSEMAHGFARVGGELGEVANQMRVLHEDVVGRIALLQESWPAPRKRRPKRQ